jgi:multiple sugar transport system substrate-binding protein
MKRRTVLILMIVFALILPMAVSAAGQDEEPAAEGVTIRFANINAEYHEYVEAAIEVFESKNPGINIDLLESFAWTEYWQKIQNLHAAGNPPDAYWMSIAYTADYAKKETTIPLDKYVGSDLSQYYTAIMDLERYPGTSGQLYTMPHQWVASLLFYNKDLFDAAGMSYPDSSWSYETLIDVSRKLTMDAEGGKQYGFFANGAHTFLDAMVNAHGGEVLAADRETCMLTEPSARATIQKVVDMIQVDESAPVAANYDALLVSAGEMFQSSRIAMTIDGSYMIESFKDSTFEWDAAIVPKGPVKRVIYGGPDGISISSGSKHPDEAWKWVEFYSGPDRPRETWVPGGVPIVKSMASSQDWHDMHSEWLSDPQVLLDTGQYVYHDWVSRWFEWRIQVMNAELAPAFVGQKSVDEAVQAAKTAIEKITRS